MASWAAWVKERGYDPQHIAENLEEAKNTSQNGKVSFDGFAHSEQVVLLNSMLILDENIPEPEKRRIIHQSTFIAGEKGKVTKDSLIAEVNRLEKAYLSRPREKYKLITEISVSGSFQLPRVCYGGVWITINPRLNAKIQDRRNSLLKKAMSSVHGALPQNYSPVSVTVNARSASEAVDNALKALDFIRAALNLYENRNKDSRISFTQREPVNPIVLGPIHTLHKPNGELATEAWWYHPGYQAPVRPYDKKKGEIEKIYKFLMNVRRHLKKLNYADEIVNEMVRYVRALDERNWENSFLQLWGILEVLTATSKKSYNVTIQRASYIFKERKYASLVLSHLREYRNKLVHAGMDSGEIEAMLYQLKRYVEALIEFHLANKYKFKSMLEVGDFLDMPDNVAEIEEKINNFNIRIDKLQKARNFIGGS